jgi:putative tryptophan/tyrosine transport system substrate-binding protein
MKRRDFLASALAVAALPSNLAAQVAPKAARIGWLTAQQESSLTPYLAAMRAGFPIWGTWKAAISRSTIVSVSS